MDIWVVAAAASAGYVAQHWKNLVKGRHSFSDSSCESPHFRPDSSSSTQQVGDKKSCPCGLVHSKSLDKEVWSERERRLPDPSMAEIASTIQSDCKSRLMLGNCADCCTHGASDLVPRLLSSEDVQVDREGIEVCADKDETGGDLLLLASRREMGVSYGFRRKKSSLRSIRNNGQFIKPLNSLESCLMAQLYKEQAEMEEYTFSLISSPCTPTARPFIVTDSSRVIGRATGNSCNLPIAAVQQKLRTATNSKDIFGVPRLRSVGSMEFQRKAMTDIQMEQGGRLSCSSGLKGKHQKLQGSSHGALLFCLGLSIGLISSCLTNKRDVDKLSDMLKQTQSLVQDLQEELEMKDSLTVKELAVEDSESQDAQHDAFNNGPLHALSPEEKLNGYHNIHNDQKEEEESFSKIEAELEAELERLELNMNSCRLDSKISYLVELDADYVPEVGEGELKAEVLATQGGSQPYADRDGSGSSTTHSVHYAVSPMELTSRLHEVIQSRLEQRVQELEIALQNSQRKVRNMESQHTSYLRKLSKSESGCCLTQGSPVAKEQNQADQPVVINLYGEALDAYNEAYDEFTNINEPEEVDTPSGVDSHRREILQTSDQKIPWLCSYEVESDIQGKSFMDNWSLFSSTRQVGEDDDYMSNGIVTSGDENDIGYDEMEELLIKHIVEKARKGSPAILNAQRALCSPDENSHSQ
ncbi:hypothetical protein ACH5RR_025759 [Cinchona calisaya]|uniref:Uncharacterized protein n=1 Tax=Cinchona calisaya TaxID=153742 RepID=A0ABD2Z0J4_9GENT